MLSKVMGCGSSKEMGCDLRFLILRKEKRIKKRQPRVRSEMVKLFKQMGHRRYLNPKKLQIGEQS